MAFAEVLAVAIGVAVGGMGCWHWFLVSENGTQICCLGGRLRLGTNF